MMQSPLQCCPKKQQGAVAILVALALTAMVGFAGLVLDLGKLYVAKTELQNSADACALAAAQALTGASGQQLDIGEAAGMTAGLRHKVLFQSSPVTMAANQTVEFGVTSSGAFVSKAGLSNSQALAMRYARCTVQRNQIDTWFIQILDILPGVAMGKQQVNARAMATLQASQVTCGLPVALCSADMPASTAVGTWMQGVIGPPGNQGLSGSFKWIDFTPPNGGASELAGILKGDGACDVPAIGTLVGQPGNIASLADEWNSRFGIYKGSVKPADAQPDQSGYAYTDAALSWPSTFNAFPNFISKRTSNAAYQGDTSTGLKTQGTIKEASYLAANGGDRRLMTAPVVDCTNFSTGSHTAPIISWACIFLLHPINNSAGGSGTETGTGAKRMYLEYRGKAEDPGSPCASNGLPGGGSSKGPLVTALVQ
jgi:Flp pilus assembly protein TadG